MRLYSIKIFSEALQDIQDASDWYELQKEGLGQRFQEVVIIHIRKLAKVAEIYSIRYEDYRCMLVKKFPFMIHYRLDDKAKEVHVYAVHHTSLDPRIWKRTTN